MRIFLLLCLFWASTAWADDWKMNREGKQRGDVSTFVRDVEGSPVKAFKGVVELEASLTSIIAVILDVDNFPSWVFQCQSAERPLFGRDRLYMRFNGIWPVSDRDVMLDNQFAQVRAGGTIVLHSVNVETLLGEERGYVRIPALDNRFTLTPLNDGWVQVEFETFVDPGGNIPIWLANLVSTQAPLKTLRGLREQVKRERYINADPDDFPRVAGVEKLAF